jgi:hypothetical protein
MSRHIVELSNTESHYRVTAGWDRPCQGFFLMVTTDDDEMVYTNMTEAVCHPKDFTFFENILATLKLTLPKDMRTALEDDKSVDRGNHFKDWSK